MRVANKVVIFFLYIYFDLSPSPPPSKTWKEKHPQALYPSSALQITPHAAVRRITSMFLPPWPFTSKKCLQWWCTWLSTLIPTSCDTNHTVTQYTELGRESSSGRATHSVTSNWNQHHLWGCANEWALLCEAASQRRRKRKQQERCLSGCWTVYVMLVLILQLSGERWLTCTAAGSSSSGF